MGTTPSISDSATPVESASTSNHDKDPVAYLVESWNDLSGSWETTVRQSRHTLPDPSAPDVRNIIPLIPADRMDRHSPE